MKKIIKSKNSRVYARAYYTYVHVTCLNAQRCELCYACVLLVQPSSPLHRPWTSAVTK